MVGVDRFLRYEELMLGHVGTLYLSSTGEPNRERCPVAGGSTVCSTQVRASLWWCSEKCVPKLKVGLEQWNFTTVGISGMSPMNWAYYPICGRGGRSPKHHKSPPRDEMWRYALKEAAGVLPLLKEKC